MSYYGGTVTVAGRNLITRLIAGDTIQFTRVVVGSGELPDGKKPIDITDLVQPIAEGTSTTPIVDNCSASMVVEYRNDMNGGLKTGFWLREFGVFAKTANTQEVLLYYATLGDSPQPVSAYQDNRIDIRRYPISIALEIDAEITVLYDTSAFVTAKDVEALVDSKVKDAVENMMPNVANIVIPTEGWESEEPDEDPEGTEEREEFDDYGLHVDIPVEGMTESSVPIVAILPPFFDVAEKCELSTTCKAIDGAVRLYARTAPSSAIYASLTYFLTSIEVPTADDGEDGPGSDGPGGGSTGSDYVLPTATADRLGGVKIGYGVDVDQDGKISVDGHGIVGDMTASKDDVAEVLDGIFGPKEG